MQKFMPWAGQGWAGQEPLEAWGHGVESYSCQHKLGTQTHVEESLQIFYLFWISFVSVFWCTHFSKLLPWGRCEKQVQGLHPSIFKATLSTSCCLLPVIHLLPLAVPLTALAASPDSMCCPVRRSCVTANRQEKPCSKLLSPAWILRLIHALTPPALPGVKEQPVKSSAAGGSHVWKMPLTESCWGILLTQLNSQLQRPRVHSGPLRHRRRKELPSFHALLGSSMGWAMVPMQGLLFPLQFSSTGCASPQRGHQSGLWSSVPPPGKATVLPHLEATLMEGTFKSLPAYLYKYLYSCCRVLKFYLLQASDFLGFPAHVEVIMSWPAY